MGNTTNLISAYKFDDDAVTTTDAFGPNTLSEGGSVVSVAGLAFGNSHQVDAAGDGWTITDAAQTGLDFTGDFSLLCWLRNSVFGASQPVILNKSYAGYSWRITAAAFQKFEVASTEVTADTSLLLVNTVYHLGVVFDTVNDTVKYYVDGALSSTVTSVTATPSGNAAAFQIFLGGDTGYADMGSALDVGALDEVVIFARTITLAEVQDIRSNGIAAFIAGPAAGAASAGAGSRKRLLMGVGK